MSRQGHDKKHHGHETLKANCRYRQRRCAQFTQNDCLGIVECHPVFVYALGRRSAHSAHGTTTTDDAHQTACSTSHAGKPLRGFSLHWCGAARCVMTCLIPHPVQTKPTEVRTQSAEHCPDMTTETIAVHPEWTNQHSWESHNQSTDHGNAGASHLRRTPSVRSDHRPQTNTEPALKQATVNDLAQPLHGIAMRPEQTNMYVAI